MSTSVPYRIMRAMDRPTPSLSRLPEEILLNIFQSLALPRPNEVALECHNSGGDIDNNKDDDGLSRSRSRVNKVHPDNITALHSICQSSTQFNRIAQPILISCAAPVIANDVVYKNQFWTSLQKKSEPSSILLLLRTLLSRPDLADKIRDITLDLSGVSEDHVEQKSITVGYMKRIFGKQTVKHVLSKSVWSRKEYYSYQVQRFPEELLLEIVESAFQWPLFDTFSRCELKLLIKQAYSIVSDSCLDRSPSSRLLRAAFEDDKIGMHLLVGSLTPKPEILAVLAGQSGTRMAGVMWKADHLQVPAPLSHTPFATLRHVSVVNTDSRVFGACLESYFLGLPELQSIEIEVGPCLTDEDVDALEDLEGQSGVKHVTIRGHPHAYYLQALLATFKFLESLNFEHIHPDPFGDDLTIEPEDTGKIVLAAVEQHKKTLHTLKIRCSGCNDCNIIGDFSQMPALKNLDAYAGFLGLNAPVQDPTTKPALSNLPENLECLRVGYIAPTCIPHAIEDAYIKQIGEFVTRIAFVTQGSLAGNSDVKDIPRRQSMFHLRRISLDRTFHYRGRGMIHGERDTGAKVWNREVPGVKELNALCEKADLVLECHKRFSPKLKFNVYN